jgi:hypothetical protein
VAQLLDYAAISSIELMTTTVINMVLLGNCNFIASSEDAARNVCDVQAFEERCPPMCGAKLPCADQLQSTTWVFGKSWSRDTGVTGVTGATGADITSSRFTAWTQIGVRSTPHACPHSLCRGSRTPSSPRMYVFQDMAICDAMQHSRKPMEAQDREIKAQSLLAQSCQENS